MATMMEPVAPWLRELNRLSTGDGAPTGGREQQPQVEQSQERQSQETTPV